MCDVFAIYDNNISPSLLMIILKIIILYFIQFQIRHTDNFPPTGTPASSYNSTDILSGTMYKHLIGLQSIGAHSSALIMYTRRVPVQRAVERVEIPYP